jgi:nicotinate-nucleotide pyrophosphorylase (carboxylating)
MKNSGPPGFLIEPIVRAALAEHLGRAGDITSAACIDADARLSARFASRRFGVVAGVACARLSLLALDPTARFEVVAQDGELLQAGTVIARASANARALLSAERTALNLMGRLSGVATLTHAYVQAVAGTGATITDTRKTTPGLRALEKYAVRCGGGVNHRFGLDDAILIKDNHVAAAGGVGPAIRRARAVAGHLVKIEAEVDGLMGSTRPLCAGRDLLDNFSLTTARRRHAPGQGAGPGGVTLDPGRVRSPK